VRGHALDRLVGARHAGFVQPLEDGQVPALHAVHEGGQVGGGGSGMTDHVVPPVGNMGRWSIV